MKRMAIIAGLVFSLAACTQHDSNSPDTSGNDPQNPNRQMTTDSSNASGGSNMNNDHSNNNQTTNTGDTSKQRENQ